MHLSIPNEPIQMMVSNIMANFHFLRFALGSKHSFYREKPLIGQPSPQRVPLTSFSLGPPQVGPRPQQYCLQFLLCQALPSCFSWTFSCLFTSPLCPTRNTLFLWSAGGVLISFSRLNLTYVL